MSCPFGYGAESAMPPPGHPLTNAAEKAPPPSGDSILPPLTEFNNVSHKNQQRQHEIADIQKKPVYYSDYLQLDKLLNAQHPLSNAKGKPCHDEHLFIVIHQTYELWFKQILHEVDSVRALFGGVISDVELGIAVRRVERVIEILKILVEQIRVLETLQPQDFLEFREFLYPASGFQSFQFRIFEHKLGLFADRNYQNKPVYLYLSDDDQKTVNEHLKQPSLLELVQRWLERTPFLEVGQFSFWKSYQEAVTNMLNRERAIIQSNTLLREETRAIELESLKRTEESFASICDEKAHEDMVRQGRRRLSHKATLGALLIFLYRDEPLLQQPYRLLSLLCDVDENLQMWRYRHMMMAHRMIGTKIGTGGSSGYAYLQKTTRTETYKVFADLFNLSTFLLPRSELPPLPAEVKSKLQFRWP